MRLGAAALRGARLDPNLQAGRRAAAPIRGMRPMLRHLARRVGERLIEWADDRPAYGEAVAARVRRAQRDGRVYYERATRPDGAEVAIVRTGGRELRLVFGRPGGEGD